MVASLAIAGCSSDSDSTTNDTDGAGDGSGNGGDVDDSGDGGNGDGSGGNGDSGNGDGSDTTAAKVLVTAIASDFSSAGVEIYNTTEPYDGQTGLNPGVSDTIVRSYEDSYYVIRRFQSDSIAAYATSDPSSVIFQSSTNDGGSDESSNPHDLVFVNDQKAYLLRYGSGKIWVVNPSATDASQFKTGEIDISAYDADGIPEATRGVVVGGKLFVFMQRLDAFAPTSPGVVAVFDTTNDAEIDTGSSGDFKGIELPAFNPWEISLDEATNTIFVAAAGDFGAFDGSRPAAFTGGILTVDTDDYSTSQLIDDTEETGRMMGVEVIDASTAFLVAQAGFGSSSVQKFDPNTGAVSDTGFGGITGVDVRDIAKGPAGNLWVGIGSTDDPRIVVLDPATGTQVGSDIKTQLMPAGITFLQ